MPDIAAPAHFDVAVIGAGQAGLAIGCLLARQDRRFVILDAADSIGASWRDGGASLVVFTPRRYDSLPGLAFPGDPDGAGRSMSSSTATAWKPTETEM
jgi:cation diffusion facilitator CzcD-associated flavoprotein CzcO